MSGFLICLLRKEKDMHCMVPDASILIHCWLKRVGN